MATEIYTIVRGWSIPHALVISLIRENYLRPSAVTQTYDEICGFLVIGWGLHYLPFYLMGRQLFLHHYFPALWFAILCFCAVFDFATRNVKRWKRIQVAVMISLLALWAYGHFSPLTYGNTWTRGQCEKSKWLRTWDFSW